MKLLTAVSLSLLPSLAAAATSLWPEAESAARTPPMVSAVPHVLCALTRLS